MNHIASHQTILIAEDSDDDFEATELALRESNLQNPLIRCETGEETLDYLYQTGKFKDFSSTLPGIILLDLNMPGVDGFKVLSKIKKDESLKKIPVVILTTSSDTRDIAQCYQKGANTFVQKPVDLDNFMDAIKSLKEFWFDVVTLPPSCP